MKSKILILTMGVFLLAVAPSMAMDGHDHDAAEENMHAEEAAATEAVNVGNKICPVSGEEIGAMGEGIPVEYEGKIYNLCCMMCISEFKKDPEKYIQRVNEELAAEDEE